MRMLLSNRVDLVISESYNGNNIIKSKEEFKNIKELKKMNETEIFSFIHKKHQSLLPSLVKALKEQDYTN
jgi:fatty acid/phospholipid biosynthesis enzyme